MPFASRHATPPPAHLTYDMKENSSINQSRSSNFFRLKHHLSEPYHIVLRTRTYYYITYVRRAAASAVWPLVLPSVVRPGKALGRCRLPKPGRPPSARAGREAERVGAAVGVEKCAQHRRPDGQGQQQPGQEQSPGLRRLGQEEDLGERDGGRGRRGDGHLLVSPRVVLVAEEDGGEAGGEQQGGQSRSELELLRLLLSLLPQLPTPQVGGQQGGARHKRDEEGQLGQRVHALVGRHHQMLGTFLRCRAEVGVLWIKFHSIRDSPLPPKPQHPRIRAKCERSGGKAHIKQTNNSKKNSSTLYYTLRAVSHIFYFKKCLKLGKTHA